MMPSTVGWEYEGATAVGTMADCPNVVAEDGVDVPWMACRPNGTLVDHLLKGQT
jgi:hypothetical protein